MHMDLRGGGRCCSVAHGPATPRRDITPESTLLD